MEITIGSPTGTGKGISIKDLGRLMKNKETYIEQMDTSEVSKLCQE